MHCLTDTECQEWLRQENIDAVDARGLPEVVGDYEVFFEAPKDARTQHTLAHEMIEWIGEIGTALLWLSDWPFAAPSENALVTALRCGHGERRSLIDAPGHLFRAEERNELVGWVFLMMGFGWDAYLFVSPFRGSMFQTSHEDFVWTTTSEVQVHRRAQQIVRDYKLTVRRETLTDAGK
jgi:hypothetical protein